MSLTITDYHVVNAHGATVYTSPDEGLARREADRRAHLGCAVEVREVQHFTTTRRVYRPRPAQVAA